MSCLSFSDDDHVLALAGLILPQPTITAVLDVLGWLDVAAEIAAIDLGLATLAADVDAADAPPIKRWTSRRKAAVVAAVHSGEITLEAARGRYELSIEEFRTWESKVAPRSALSAVAIDLLNSINPSGRPQSSGQDVGKPPPGRSIQAAPLQDSTS